MTKQEALAYLKDHPSAIVGVGTIEYSAMGNFSQYLMARVRPEIGWRLASDLWGIAQDGWKVLSNPPSPTQVITLVEACDRLTKGQEIQDGNGKRIDRLSQIPVRWFVETKWYSCEGDSQ